MSLFHERIKDYFPNDYNKFLELLNNEPTQGFFLNTNKANKEDILNLLDFDYYKSDLTNDSYYHLNDNIGKTKAYELGLIYPQGIESSLTTSFIKDKDIKTIVDLCSAPGGKSINALNRFPNSLCICNDTNYSRSLILSSNLERLGLDNVIVTNKDCDTLAKQLNNFADLLILDAPCSGEGMIRKYPEILDTYSLENIHKLANIQEKLLDNAYDILKGDGILIYSTCTYAFEEDENQINNFLNKYPDMHIISIDMNSNSKIKGTLKLSPLDNLEGQFICMMYKDSNSITSTFKELKTVKDNIVDTFIKDNLNINNYYLYKNNDNYYLSLHPLIDLKSNVLRYGIYIGSIKNKRFEPSHCLYRANSLREHFIYTYDLNDEEYLKYISGNEFKTNLDSNYYLLTYHNYSIGYGKCSNKTMKNKYPKGLRRML